MKIVREKIGLDAETLYIDTEERDLNSDPIRVYDMNDFGATNVGVGNHAMTWPQVDILIAALQLAKKEWEEPKKEPVINLPGDY